MNSLSGSGGLLSSALQNSGLPGTNSTSSSLTSSELSTLLNGVLGQSTTSLSGVSGLSGNSTTGSNGVTALGGIVSGIDTQSLISRIISFESQPLNAVQSAASTLQAQVALYQTLNTSLSAVGTALTPLVSPSSFLQTTATISGPGAVSASVTGNPTVGDHSVTVSSLGSQSRLESTASLSRLDTAASLTRAGFKTPLQMTAVNVQDGQAALRNVQGTSAQVQVSTPGSLATGSYQIDVNNLATLTSLASAATPLDPTQSLAAQKPDLIFGQSFTINGASIALKPNDTLNDVIGRINSSAAGVNASYDTASGVLSLQNKLTGADPINLGGDGTGFFNAFGLNQQNQHLGQDADFVVTANGASVHYRSADNGGLQVNELPGLTFSLQGAGTTTFDVNATGGVTQGGHFTVNGVDIAYQASSTLDQIEQAVDQSSAGVTLSYNRANDQFTFASNSGGAVSVSDQSGSLLQSMGFGGAGSGTGTLTSQGSLARAVDPSQDVSLALRAPVQPGSFTINGTTIAVNQGDSLATVLDRITNSNAGVTASYNSAADHVVLTAKNLGNSAITVGGDTTGFLAAAHLDSAQTTAGSDVALTVDGTAHQETSRTVTDAIPGVTLDVNSVSPAGSPTTVSIQQNTAATAQNVQTFVNDINNVYDFVAQNSQVGSVSNGQITPSGPFLGNVDVDQLMGGLTGALLSQLPGSSTGISSLQDIGITFSPTGGTYGNPHLTVDSTALNAALQQNPTGVGQLFSAPGGVGQQVDQVINEATAHGGFYGGLDVMQQQLDSLNQRASTLHSRIAVDQAQLTSQFNAMEQSLAVLQGQGGALQLTLNSFLSASVQTATQGQSTLA